MVSVAIYCCWFCVRLLWHAFSFFLWNFLLVWVFSLLLLLLFASLLYRALFFSIFTKKKRKRSAKFCHLKWHLQSVYPQHTIFKAFLGEKKKSAAWIFVLYVRIVCLALSLPTFHIFYSICFGLGDDNLAMFYVFLNTNCVQDIYIVLCYELNDRIKIKTQRKKNNVENFVQ